MLEITFKKDLADFVIDISFKVESAGITALFGPSGAGKSSIVNMIAGLLNPDGGKCDIGGQVLFDSGKKLNIKPANRRVGYVFQESRLFPHMSVNSNLFYGRRFSPKGDRYIHPPQVIKILGLEKLLDRQPLTLSGGEKQRVAIGRALLSEPKILLMDEPLAGLDEERKSEVISYIQVLYAEIGIPIIYVSHSINEVLQLADNMILLSEGKIISYGSTTEIIGRPDLARYTGQHEAGTLINAVLEKHDSYGLANLSFSGGIIRVPRLRLPNGSNVRVRVRARDIAIAMSLPKDISMINIYYGTVLTVSPDSESAVDVEIDIGTKLWARITSLSASELGLSPGKKVYALVKSVSIDNSSLLMTRASRF